MSERENTVRVACLQMTVTIGEKEHNLARSVSLIQKAAAEGAKLIVLPELCNIGYAFANRADVWRLAENVPDGPTCKVWDALAREHGIYIVAGIAERAGDCIYNASVLIGPTGYIGTYHKAHLWNEEKLLFEPGDLGFPVYNTAIGRVAMLICYDGCFPEAYRTCTLHRADIICLPTNWTRKTEPPPGHYPMAIYDVMSNAHLNGLFVAASNRVGTERGKVFLGNSIIVGPRGWLLASPASADREEILAVDCNLMDARRSKRWGDLNEMLQDRRVDLYGDQVVSMSHVRSSKRG